MTEQLITSIGLIADIAGAVLLYHFGLPNSDKFGAKAIVMQRDVARSEAGFRLYGLLSKLGVWLLIGGFALQLLGANVDCIMAMIASP